MAALADGLQTVDAITSRIYPDLRPALIPMARESVLAHLIKLEGDGTARRHDVHWAIVG